MEENSTLLLNEDNSFERTLIVRTPKSQKQNDTDVRRWASVVKAKKSIINSPEANRFVSENDDALETFDSLPDIISKRFENHKGFITCNNNSYFCQICSLYVNTMIMLKNHLKTRKHEDNVIVFLKDKLPAHLEHMMEFVSFCKSDLCCNLCQQTIEMSLNPHETILNIIAHNTDMTHTSLRAKHDGDSIANSLLNTLSETHPVIMENLHFIVKKIIPQFKCKLCESNISCNENVELLGKHFITHFRSFGHVENQKTNNVLSLFDEVSISEKDTFVVINGYILCTVCNARIDTNVEKLILHVKGVEHTSNSLAELQLCSAIDGNIDSRVVEKNEVSVNKSFVFHPKFQWKKFEKEKVGSKKNVNPDSKLNTLMTLPSDIKYVDYLDANDNGSVVCLICNCVLPPSKQNLLSHLNGNIHQRQVKSKNVSKLENPKIQRTSQSRESSHAHYLKLLLKSLPENLGNINYIVTNGSGGAECLVCQCDIPLVPSQIENHLKSADHKKNNNKSMKPFSGCPCQCSNTTFMKDILNLPKDLRVYKCQKVNTTGPASIYNDFSWLLKKNVLISKSKDLLVMNVDGKNCYCKLCKSLIPLYFDINDLEKNLFSHLLGKTHIINNAKSLGTKLPEVKKAQPLSSTGKVTRSLFVSCSGDEKKTEISKNNICKGLSSSDKQMNNFSTSLLKKKSSGGAQSHDSLLKKDDSEVFVFGKNDSNDRDMENSKDKSAAFMTIKDHKALPVSKTTSLPFEVEVDEAVLSRRQKQLDYGKNTDGYARYRKVVPLSKRRPSHLTTPPKHIKCSRRKWDGMVRVWRKKIHDWDLPQESTSLEQDIQPLPFKVC